LPGNCPSGLDIGFAALSYLQVAVLGVIQGISELLPISSTAHMRIVPALLGWNDPGSAFSAANACNSPLRSLNVIGASCLVMAALLAIAELACKHLRVMEQMRLRDALIVGVAQIGALIPGVSRSGSTLTAALFLNMKREEAARFSFLLGLPAIALAGMKELWVLHKAHIPPEAWSLLLFGIVVASISAFIAIWGLMRFLERFSTWPFVVYRAILGLVLLIGVNMGALH